MIYIQSLLNIKNSVAKYACKNYLCEITVFMLRLGGKEIHDVDTYINQSELIRL